MVSLKMLVASGKILNLKVGGGKNMFENHDKDHIPIFK